jgi:rRNA maturation protein Nop10
MITILDLENKNTYTLYELDKNEDIQNFIQFYTLEEFNPHCG